MVGDMRVLIPDNTRIIGEIQAGFFVSVNGITHPEGVIVANEVKMREYSLEGLVEEHRGDKWVIESVQVITGSETFLHGDPDVGSDVLVIAWRKAGGELVARLIETVVR